MPGIFVTNSEAQVEPSPRGPHEWLSRPGLTAAEQLVNVLMPPGRAYPLRRPREVRPMVNCTPVLAGVCGTDPFRLMRVFLPELQRLAFDRVQNFPAVGLVDAQFRQILEERALRFRT